MLGEFLDVDPAGKFALLAARYVPRVYLVPLDGGEPRQMPGFTEGQGWAMSPAFSPDGRLALAAERPAILRIWDLETGELRKLDLNGNGEHCGGQAETYAYDLDFVSNRRVLISDSWGIRLWSLEDGSNLEVRPCRGKEVMSFLAVDRQRGRFLVVDVNNVERVSTFGLHELESKTYREITSHGNRVSRAALDPTGTIAVTGDMDGIVRVGPVTGEEPHLLFGDSLAIWNIVVSPDGRWIASASLDGTIRLWPMPEGTPFHTLPYEEILERIRGLTNLRVVPDESAGTGYRVEIGPFPGWKKLPDW